MTDLDDNEPQLPTRVRRLGGDGTVDPRDDRILPLAAVTALTAVLGLTCAPISTAFNIAAARQQAAATSQPSGGLLPPGGPGPVALALVGIFVGIAFTGIVGSIGTILMRNWGRLLLLSYAGLVLLYLVGVVTYRLRMDLAGVTQTAPTTSALIPVLHLHGRDVFGGGGA